MIKRKFKNAQVTPLIIVSVLIVAFLIIYFSVNKNLVENVNPDVSPIYDFVDGCVDELGKDAILDTSNYGGYFISPELSNGEIAYYLKNGDNLMPSKEKIESELASYVDNLITFCVGDFENFPDYNIESVEIKTAANIEKEKVIFDVNYSISIKKGEKSYQLKNFNAEIPARLGIIYDSVGFIMEDQMKDKKSICVTCLHQISENYDFYVNAINIGENNVIYTIKDENVKINEKPLVFNFVNELEEL